MRDHVNDELISAYVDGELEEDERKLVEDLLAESPECQQLLADFQSIRASLRALPIATLPAEFHTHVVRQLDHPRSTHQGDGVHPPSRRAPVHPWRGVFIAAASLAAVIAVTMMLQPPSPAPIVPGQVTAVPMPVYFQQQSPKYVMIYDVTLTPAGQEAGVVDRLFKRLEIGVDPTLRLDRELEKELITIRESKFVPGAIEATPFKNDRATAIRAREDRVEMIYVAGTVGVLDRLGLDLRQLAKGGSEVTGIHFDFAVEPNKIGVMHRLHDAAYEHFASRSSMVPSDTGEAFRLALTYVSVSTAANLELPSDSAAAMSSRSEADVADEAFAAGAVSRVHQDDSDAEQATNRDPLEGMKEHDPRGNWDMEPGHILLIIRTPGAGSAESN